MFKTSSAARSFSFETLRISNSGLDYALRAKKENAKGEHGSHLPSNKSPDDNRRRVMQHIELFPYYESRYTRSHQKEKKSLLLGLTQTYMKVIYKEKMTKEKHHAASYYVYTSIFNTEFNLGFHQAVKDSCKTCDYLESQIKHGPPEAKRDAHTHKASPLQEGREGQRKFAERL